MRRDILLGLFILVLVIISASVVTLGSKIESDFGKVQAPRPDQTANANLSPLTDGAQVVLFATDRRVVIEQGRLASDIGRRGQLRYGVARVTIPPSHRRGLIERPSWIRLELSEDPARHIVLHHIETMPRERWVADLRRWAAGGGGRALLFVHGYNVGFEEALWRTAQIAHDVQFAGPPILYSWPSKASTALYTQDEQDIEWTKPHLRQVLADVVKRSGAKEVILIAHSMGNRALASVLVELGQQDPSARAVIRDVILAAPDIDAEVFARDIAPRLSHAARRVTLYASSQDRALAASKAVHGYPRAGDAGRGLVIVPPIQTIDATGVDTELLGHSYIGTSPTVLSDMFYLIQRDAPAEARDLQLVRRGTRTYWRFRPSR